MLTGMQDRVAQAIGMIRELDKPPPGEADLVPDAARRIETLEKRVVELETQIKILTDKLADAVKNRK
jgi:cell division protein FtsB